MASFTRTQINEITDTFLEKFFQLHPSAKALHEEYITQQLKTALSRVVASETVTFSAKKPGDFSAFFEVLNKKHIPTKGVEFKISVSPAESVKPPLSPSFNQHRQREKEKVENKSKEGALTPTSPTAKPVPRPN